MLELMLFQGTPLNGFIGAWEKLPSAHLNRTSPGMASANGLVYTFSGYDNGIYQNTLLEYNPETKNWRYLKTGPSGRTKCKMVSDGTRLYAVGGRPASGPELKDLWIYTPSTDTWSTGAACPIVLNDGALAAIGDTLYGLASTGSFQMKLVYYSIASNTWNNMPNRPNVDTWDTPMAGAGQKLYTAGGRKSSGGFTDDFYEFDTVTWQWKLLAPLPRAMYDNTMVVVDGMIYLLGGHAAAGPNEFIYMYDPAINTWITVAKGPILFGGNAVVATDGKIYMGFGATILGQPNYDWYRIKPGTTNIYE